MDTRRGFFGKLFGGLAVALVAPKTLAVHSGVDLAAGSDWSAGGWVIGSHNDKFILNGHEAVIPAGHYRQAQMDYELLRAAGVSPENLRKAFKGKL